MSMADYERGIEEPWVAWDRYCERQELAYAALVADKTCEDCGNCDVPNEDFNNPGRIGYCRHWAEFVSLDAMPAEEECEDFC